MPHDDTVYDPQTTLGISAAPGDTEEGPDTPSVLGAPSGFEFQYIPNQYSVYSGPSGAYARTTTGGAFSKSRYFSGDEYGPQSWPGDAVVNLQVGLVNAGLLDPDEVTVGVWMGDSVKAYRDVLSFANQFSATDQEALAFLSKLGLPKKGSRSGSSGAGRRVRLSHPDDLRAVANKVAPGTIGRRLTADETQRFINAFQSMERGESAPSPDVAAETFAQQVDPTAAQGRDLVGVYGAFVNLLRGGGQNASV